MADKKTQTTKSPVVGKTRENKKPADLEGKTRENKKPVDSIVKKTEVTKVVKKTSEVAKNPSSSLTPTTEKKALIIYVHPYNRSFCSAIRDAAIRGLQARNKPFEVIDLYADKFNPTFEGKDLALYSRGKSTDPHVIKYTEMLLAADEVIFTYPIWWSDRPAILKGFFDKVFLSNHFWKPAKFIFSYPKGTTNWIRRVRVFTTCQTPKSLQCIYLRHSAKHSMVRGTLKALGMKGIEYRNFSQITDSKIARRQRWLERVERECSRP